VKTALLVGGIVLAVASGAAAQAEGGRKGPAMKTDTALLVIDIQYFYFDGGRLELTKPVDAARQARRVIDAFRAKGQPVIHIRHIPASVAIVDGEPVDPQYRIHPEVAPQAGETIITKRFPNSFRETDLLAELKKRQVTKLVIVGMQTHMCVEAATRAATDLGFDVTVLDEACATRPLTFAARTVPAEMVHAAVLAALNGSYGRVISVEEFLKAW
jgi:nicotinamidase-related amidase